MTLFKRGKLWWMDAAVNGHRYRESLGTTDARKAPALERERIAKLQHAPAPTKRSKEIGSMTISEALVAYTQVRASQVSPRMADYWREQSRPMARSKALGKLKLNRITAAAIAAYQAERLADGKAPKTINGEVSVLRQVLKHAKLWYRIQDDYKPVPNDRPPVGRALSDDEVARLFEIAGSRPDWMYAHAAATLAFYCGMRACEIKGLRWKDVDWTNRIVDIRRSKTPAGWRSPSLNSVCFESLRTLHSKAASVGADEADHYIFPWHGREQRIDPTRPITSWRSAWRSILKAAGLQGVRFHDGRHTVVTTLAEKGVPDWVIQAQVGHVDARMMKTYSHIRRRALEEAAAALEPPAVPSPTHAAGESGLPLIG